MENSQRVIERIMNEQSLVDLTVINVDRDLDETEAIVYAVLVQDLHGIFVDDA